VGLRGQGSNIDNQTEEDRCPRSGLLILEIRPERRLEACGAASLDSLSATQTNANQFRDVQAACGAKERQKSLAKPSELVHQSRHMKATPMWIGVLAGALLMAGSGCRSVYYATWEKLGVEKRDLLTKAVVAARDEQKAAGEEFQDALGRLQQITSFDGGKLEAAYRDLRKDLESAEARAAAVGKRIRTVEQVSGDLFAEWEREIRQISTPNLRAGSEEQLRATRGRYDELHAALTRAEQSMAPVLTQLKDYTLYLKHNVNAAAIASLRGEAANIQADIGKLLGDMNASIAKADEFVQQMGGTR
jgi:hypothetical protein